MCRPSRKNQSDPPFSSELRPAIQCAGGPFAQVVICPGLRICIPASTWLAGHHSRRNAKSFGTNPWIPLSACARAASYPSRYSNAVWSKHQTAALDPGSLAASCSSVNPRPRLNSRRIQSDLRVQQSVAGIPFFRNWPPVQEEVWVSLEEERHEVGHWPHAAGVRLGVTDSAHLRYTCLEQCILDLVVVI